MILTISASANAQEIWNNEAGLKKLEKSQFKNDFYQLLNFYQPQINPVFCSVASSVIVLNALKYGNIESQKELEFTKENGAKIEYKLYSQNYFLNDRTNKIKARAVIEAKIKNQNNDFDAGLALDDLSKILSEVYQLKVVSRHIEKLSEPEIESFRSELKSVLSDQENFIIANYDGTKLGQKINGHFSPIIAYESESDSLLVMDVALHKNQWFWIELPKFFKAMNSKDGEKFRGYLVIKNR